MQILKEILEELKKMNEKIGYTYAVVKISDDGERFSASLAQLADNGFELVQIVNKNVGKYEIIVRKKIQEKLDE